MQIAVLDANTDRSAFAARHPRDDQKFRNLLGPLRPDWRISGFSVVDGVFPDTLAGIDGFIISGSPASVHDPEPWIARLLELIRQAVAAEVPVFGACFGHQAIAVALGGAVGKNPHGWSLGAAEVANTDPAPWMAGAAAQTTHAAAHKEQVTRLPEGARILGGRADVPVGHMALGSRVFSTQYHPELDAAFMEDLVAEMSGTAPGPVLNAARQSLTSPMDTATMADWIVRFLEQGSETGR